MCYYNSVRRWECKNQHSKRQFSVKNGTILEEPPIPSDKRPVAMWLLANCRNGTSAYEIHRALKVTQKSAWFMMNLTTDSNAENENFQGDRQ